MELWDCRAAFREPDGRLTPCTGPHGHGFPSRTTAETKSSLVNFGAVPGTPTNMHWAHWDQGTGWWLETDDENVWRAFSDPQRDQRPVKPKGKTTAALELFGKEN